MKSITLFPSAPKAVAILTKLEGEIDNVPTFEKLDKIIREAKAIQAANRDIADISVRAGRLHVKAVAKLGREVAAAPKAKGTRGQLAGKVKGTSKGSRGSSGGTKKLPPEEVPTAKDLGLTKKRSAEAQKLAELPSEKVESVMTDLASAGKVISPGTVLQAIRKQAKVEKKHAVAAAEFSADGPFGTVVIDPPWEMAKIDRDVRPNQDAFDYPTMSVEEISAFFNADLSPKLEPDCHLFMWTTQKWLPAAISMLQTIGFKYVLTMVWHKAGGFQPVEMPQYNCEFVVYARRGSPVFVTTKDFPCCFEGERREHSRKPDRFYDIVGRVTGGSRIDIFSRERREGFAQYGNEIAKFTEAA